MQRSLAFLLFVVAILLAGQIQRAAADESTEVIEDEFSEVNLVLRAQSPASGPSTRISPPPLRMANVLAQPTADPYLTGEVCPPCPTNCPPALPAMDAYTVCPEPPVAQSCQFGVFGEFLYLKPRNVEIPYAVPQNGILIPGSAPTGPVAVVNPGYEPGFRAGGFFGLGQDSRVIATYTWYQNNNTTSNASASGTDVLNPLVLFPGTFNAGSTAQTAAATDSINFQLIDVDYEVVAKSGPLYWWGYWGGARYAILNQNFTANFPFAPPDGTTNLATEVKFSGVGPSIGLQGERVIFPNCGIRAYGKSSASFLVGKFNSSYLQTNQFNGTEVNTSMQDDRIVPILDLELGLAWLSRGQHMRISGGYLVSAWFNTVGMNQWISAVQQVTFLPGSDTLTFDGLTARAEVKF